MSKKLYLLALFIALGLLGIAIYQKITLDDGRLHLIFCNVGQGDAILIRTPRGSDILVDGGPDERVLSCLGKHLPFWDRKLEMVILSHPHTDHFVGLLSVLKRYSVLSFVSEKLVNKSLGFSQLLKELEVEKLSIQNVYAGDKFTTKDGLSFQILAPSRSFLERTSPAGEIGESGEFASLVTLVSFGEFDFLLTGDSQVEELKEGIEGVFLPGIEVLQVPHHGSRSGLDSSFLNEVRPRLAVISVGKNNRYGHPNEEILKILRDMDIKMLRTDLNGEVEIISDGKKWSIK